MNYYLIAKGLAKHYLEHGTEEQKKQAKEFLEAVYKYG